MHVLLPIGTVVLLKQSNKRVMIYGRLQREIDGERIWDYIGCLYPEGNINPDHSYLFDNAQIDSVYFVGCQDEEEMRYQQFLRDTSLKSGDDGPQQGKGDGKGKDNGKAIGIGKDKSKGIGMGKDKGKGIGIGKDKGKETH